MRKIFGKSDTDSVFRKHVEIMVKGNRELQLKELMNG